MFYEAARFNQGKTLREWVLLKVMTMLTNQRNQRRHIGLGDVQLPVYELDVLSRRQLR